MTKEIQPKDFDKDTISIFSETILALTEGLSY